jgi:hypothetical protein
LRRHPLNCSYQNPLIYGRSSVAGRGRPALATGSGRFVLVGGEAAFLLGTGVVRRPGSRVGAAGRACVASLAALAACFRGPLPVVGEIAGTVLATDMTGARGSLTILGEVSRITGATFFCHWVSFHCPILAGDRLNLAKAGTDRQRLG